MKRIIIVILVSLVVIFGSVYYKYFYLDGKSAEMVEPIKTEEIVKKPEVVELLFVGDVMLDRGVKQKVNAKFGGDYEKIFEFVKDGVESVDLAVLNLEGPVSDLGSNVGSIYSFRMATSVVPVIKNVGFDIATFSNNHVGDWGSLAFSDTIKRFRDEGVKIVGADFDYQKAQQPAVIIKKDIKFGFLAFSDVGPAHMKAGTTTAGILLLSDPNLEQIIKDAKNSVDQLIVSVHWGEEYSKAPTARQQEFGHKLVDWGASVVVGHHPHVVLPAEKYNKGLIVYSLGNFVFDQKFSKETMEGGVLFVNIGKDAIKEYGLQRIELDQDYRPFFTD